MSDSSQSILKLNKKQIGFKIISWEFYIGAYQPAQKWLKDRKGRILSFKDIQYYEKIIVALAETKCANHSYLNASTGFLSAVLQFCKLTVNKAIPNAIIPPNAKTHQLRLVLYAKF